MKIISMISELSFKKDGNNWIFYKWGKLSRGYVLSSNEYKKRMMDFLKSYNIFNFSIMFYILFIINDIYILPLYFALSGFVYSLNIHNFTKGLPRSNISLSKGHTTDVLSKFLSKKQIFIISIILFAIFILSVLSFFLLKENFPLYTASSILSVICSTLLYKIFVKVK